MVLQGKFYLAKQAQSIPAHCLLQEGELTVSTELGTQTFTVQDTRINSKLGSLPRKFSFADGSCFECEDKPEIGLWLKSQGVSSVSHVANKFENSWKMVVGLAVVAVLTLGLVYTKGIPAFASWAAFQLPASVQTTMGKQVLTALDKTLFDKSELSNAQQQAIRTAFQDLIKNMPKTLAITPSLHFRAGGKIGANALAIPNGDIIITDELIALAKNNKVAIQGVLAHEIGHLKNRHSIRQAISLSAIPVILAVVAGDLINASAVASSLPIVLLEQGYGRDFERESDQYSRDLLWSMNIDTQPVADLFAALKNAREKEKNDAKKKDGKSRKSENSIFATHPSTTERVKFFSQVRP